MLNSQIGREWKKLNFLIRNAGFQPPCYLQKIFDDNQGGKLVGPPREAPVTSIPCKTTEAFTKKHVYFCVCPIGISTWQPQGCDNKHVDLEALN